MGTERLHGEQTLLFNAELRPNRSLSPRGFRILMAAVGVVCFGLGLAFFLAGAWPVIGFLGLDVAAIYLAFRLSYRSGRLRETVRLSQAELSIDRFQPNGRRRHWSFQPYWAKVRLEIDDAEAVDIADDPTVMEGQGSVVVSSHGQRVRLGRFLAPGERRSFADALNLALSRLALH
ncbi:MAG: DUF2244 domain-containing protein [Alphaproteobacteria bacterium]|jgi:uncharacterized membrane protein|nr:DUF2244 domain-containing protein [Alphaproteobacteria bacterium]MDP6831467.1 DUF2244 domain-containing protein [Alphaproteobacteria bacterium]